MIYLIKTLTWTTWPQASLPKTETRRQRRWAPPATFSTSWCVRESPLSRQYGRLTLAASPGRRLLTPALCLPWSGRRNSPRPLVPAASPPGTAAFIFILYKLNPCFLLIPAPSREPARVPAHSFFFVCMSWQALLAPPMTTQPRRRAPENVFKFLYLKKNNQKKRH